MDQNFRKDVELFLNVTEEARHLSERDRDYTDNKQWTREEEAKLRSRNQAPIIVNRIKPKVEGLKGLLINRRTDPKAFPRTQAHEESAEVVTDALRYVADNVDLDNIEMDVADNVFVEGYGGALVNVKRKGDEIEIDVEHIPWDRLYYDPHSRKHDFSDAAFMGIIIWMAEKEAIAKFGEKVTVVDSAEYETFEDRPRWHDTAKSRVRVCQHFYKENGVWHMCYFSGDNILTDAKPSPYLDEDGESCCPIEMVSAHIDRDNMRFGEVRYWIDLQDEINHRRSKALHLLSVRQTAARKGAVDDVDSLKRELAKANGHVEYQGEKGDFEILPTSDMAQAQFALLEEAKGEIDAVGFNAQLSGERQGNLSGKAVNLLQQAGTMELASTFSQINGWKKRLYRQIWWRIRQFWDREKWVRVTDNEKNLKWVGFNVPVTVQEALEEKINDESQPEQLRRQAAMLFTQMMNAQDPRLESLVEVKNQITELDMDIILDQSVDNINIQQEQFELLTQLAQARPEIPITAVIKMSQLRNKEELLDEMTGGGEDGRLQAMQQQFQQVIEQAQQALAEKDAQIEQMKQQQDAKNHELYYKNIESERKATSDLAKAEVDREKLSVEMEKLEVERQKLACTEMESRATVDTASHIQQVGNAIQNLARATDTSAEVMALINEMRRPKEVLRDENGNIAGIA